MCYMSPCVACEIRESEPIKGEKRNAIFES